MLEGIENEKIKVMREALEGKFRILDYENLEEKIVEIKNQEIEQKVIEAKKVFQETVMTSTDKSIELS